MNEPSPMDLFVDSAGDVRCIYDEALDLREIGKLQITRASHVEPDRDGFWWADMGPVRGPVLGPFKNRTEALGAEREWLKGCAAIDVNTKPAPETQPGKTPCDALPSDCARRFRHRIKLARPAAAIAEMA